MAREKTNLSIFVYEGYDVKEIVQRMTMESYEWDEGLSKELGEVTHVLHTTTYMPDNVHHASIYHVYTVFYQSYADSDYSNND